MNKRPFRVYVATAVILAACPGADADTIRLKNGRSILADNVREVNGRIEYSIGDNTFAISKSSVERIDGGGSPIVPRRDEMPELPVAEEARLEADADLPTRVVHDGRVDVDALNTIEGEGNPKKTAVAYFYAAKHERANGSLDAASRHLSRARSFLPDNAILTGHHATVLMQMGQMTEAAGLAERVVRLEPNVAYSHHLLGAIYYQQGKRKESVRSLERSLEIQPDEAVRELLDKAKRDLSAESAFTEEASSHFTLRYEGEQAAAPLRRQILEILEQDFNELVRVLDYVPRESIQVVLYTNKQFFDVTQMPAWTGAVNDGKLRIPVSGLVSVDSDLARVLKHELTHSFVALITRNRAPTWLHEGIAQLQEPRTTDSSGRRLAALYAAGRNIPLNQLEGPFIRFSTAEATVAYAQSLAAAEYLQEAYGASSIAMALKRIGEGQSTESALRSAIRSGYAQLEQEIAAWLKRKYGE